MTVRELIVQLAEIEDAQQRAAMADHGWPPADLAQREQAIVAELHRRGLGFRSQSGDMLARLVDAASRDAGDDENQPAVVVPSPEVPAKIVRLSGPLDASTGNAILHQLLAGLNSSDVLVVDLTDVDALDLAGVGILETVRRQAAIGGRDVRLIGAPGKFLPLLAKFTTLTDGPTTRASEEPLHD